jgi:ubiquinone biosynthesis protein
MSMSLLRSIMSREIHDNEMSTVLLELKDIIVAHGLKVPTYFYLFARALVTLEGVLEKLDPELDQFEMVRPYLTQSISRNYSPILMGKKVFNSIYELTDYMEDFPRDLKNAIRKINKGKVEVDLTHKGIDPIIHTFKRLTTHLVSAFIMVALIIGSSLFIISKIPPLWNDISVVGLAWHRTYHSDWPGHAERYQEERLLQMVVKKKGP